MPPEGYSVLTNEGRAYWPIRRQIAERIAYCVSPFLGRSTLILPPSQVLDNFWIYPAKKQKRTIGPTMVRNGPNKHIIMDTNPLMNWPVGISTVGSVPSTGEHGRYRRSVRFHLRENTVDIDDQFGYTYWELWSSSIINRDNFVIGWTNDTCEKFAEKGLVLFTRILGLLWDYFKQIFRIRILRKVRKIERLFPGANLVVRLA